MVQPEAQGELTESNLSIREQLLLAQAVHQVKSTGSTEKTIDWNQVTSLLQQFIQSNKIEGLHFSFDNQTVCSDAYAKLCQSHLQDVNQISLDGPQTLAIIRQLYAIYIKSIAEALLEEEQKCQRVRNEIEAISRGEWDAKLQVAVAESNEQLPMSPLRPELSSPEPRTIDTKKLSEPPNLISDSESRRTPGRKSPNLKDRRATVITKEVQQGKPSASGTNDKQSTRGRKRKVPPLSISDSTRKVEKPAAEEPEKQSMKNTTSRSRTPKAPQHPGSDGENADDGLEEEEEEEDDDDDAKFEQLITADAESIPTTTKKNHRFRQNRHIKPERSDVSDSNKDSSHSDMPQSKRARLQDEEDVLSHGDLENTGKSPATGHSPSCKKESASSMLQKSAHGFEAPNCSSSSKLPAATQSPTDGNLSGKLSDESHSTTHSPGSTKKFILENEVSADGSFVGTPNSATFGISATEGNLTANQTPNSAKLSLFPTTTEASSTSSLRGAGTTNDPTSFRRRMLKTHSSVQSNPISSIFRDPVKESEAPGYYSIIKRPMDLRTLAKKLRDGKVVSTEEYRRDLMLMLANAVMFNHEDSEVTRHAKELMVECDRLVSIFMRGSRY